MSDPAPGVPSRRKALEAMRALLSDDHNYERGRAALQELVDQIVREEDAEGLAELSVTLSLGLARAFERIASDQGLAAADIAEVWFAE
jgi:predicted transposase YdaD